MQIELIAAVDSYWAIGKDGKIPWHLPDDFKHFKNTTHGYPIIMGRGTFESIGKPLPGRTNIVLTRDREYVADGVSVVYSMDEAKRIAKELGHQRCFVIGGASIYRAFLDEAHIIHLTVIHTGVIGADTFFPALEPRAFEVMDRKEHPFDSKHAHSFVTYKLKRVGEMGPFQAPVFGHT